MKKEILFILSLLPLTLTGCSTGGKSVSYGYYPQSEVTDEALKTTLTEAAGTLPTAADTYDWSPYYGYYIECEAVEYMYYINITHTDGNKYRGVYFTSYRPTFTKASSVTNQDDNGYYINNVYWFKYEPIMWNEFTNDNGETVYDSKYVLDGYQFYYLRTDHYDAKDDITINANNYRYSDIRSFANTVFRNTAFTDEEKEAIKLETVDNSVASTGDSTNKYACEDTEDYIYLLSYQEATTYYTSNKARKKLPTDYAKCQGISCYEGYANYWLRSPRYSDVNEVIWSGKTSQAGLEAYWINGFSPALTIK